MTRYRAEIEKIALDYNLDPRLVEAVVITESNGNTDAFTFEPDYWNRTMKPQKQFVGANPRRVSSRYGLMQVMYPVAVERGFSSDTQPEFLFVPEVNLIWGCVHLRFLLDWAAEFTATPQQQLEAALASYNGGRGGNKPTDTPLRNASYVRKVLTNLNILKGAAS